MLYHGLEVLNGSKEKLDGERNRHPSWRGGGKNDYFGGLSSGRTDMAADE